MIDREPRIGIIIPAGSHIRGAVEDELRECGFKYELIKNGSLHAHVLNAPVDFTVQNHSDIIGHVERGIYEGGFVGSDAYQEYLASLADGVDPQVIVASRLQLFDSTVKVSILTRKPNRIDGRPYRKVSDLEGRRVVTTYKNLTERFFDRYFSEEQKKPVVDARGVTGKEEGQVAGRKAEACVVVVHTGGAMKENNLRELATVMTDIQPLLIYNPEAILAKGGQRAWEQFLDRLLNCDRRNKNLSGLQDQPSRRIGIVQISPTVQV